MRYLDGGTQRLVKKAVIELSLVEESVEKSSQEIADEIFADISKGRITIPWCKQVTKVVVIDV